MCVTCGCSDDSHAKITNLETGQVSIIHSHDHESHTHESHTHVLPDGRVITHSHEDDNSTPHIHAQIHGTTISLEQEILGKNNLIAAQNRGWFLGRNILALNLMSSPGAGKTSLLTRTINDLQSNFPISVIEGDQATINDAAKIRATGCNVVQINTGTGCHLDAEMVEKGLRDLNPPMNSLVAIENVGNLVCPALFDLGESHKIVILSVTEGDDKPIKYPHMFQKSDVAIITKIDLLSYVDFNVDTCINYLQQVNPHIKVFQVSSVTGEGLNDWYAWLQQNVANHNLA